MRLFVYLLLMVSALFVACNSSAPDAGKDADAKRPDSTANVGTATNNTSGDGLAGKPVPAVKSEAEKSGTKPATDDAPVVAEGLRGNPQMSFDEYRHEYGTIKQGQVVTHKFRFTNTGGMPLEILKAEASCGCTRPTYPFMPIAPGESAEIEVSFDSKTKQGNQYSTVTITANTPERTHKVFMTGTVVVDGAAVKTDSAK